MKKSSFKKPTPEKLKELQDRKRLKMLEKAKTRKANASARNANNNQCFSLRVLFCSCSIDFKKVKLEKKTVLYLLKWKR